MGFNNFESIVLTFLLATLMTVFFSHEYKKRKSVIFNHPKRKDERVLFYNIYRREIFILLAIQSIFQLIDAHLP